MSWASDLEELLVALAPLALVVMGVLLISIILCVLAAVAIHVLSD